MYEIIVLNSVAKELRKYDKPVRDKIISAMDKLAENPYIGDRLKGDLATIYSYHLKVSGVEYRIAYQIKEQEIVVIVMQIGTREDLFRIKKAFVMRNRLIKAACFFFVSY